MAISKNKTQPTKKSVTAFIKELPSADAQKEARALLALFKEATGMKPVMWGNIVGFGSYHYRYDSGREGDSMATGFALRKSGPTIYIMPGYQDYSAMLKDLGPHTLGKSCLYLKRLADVKKPVLMKIIKAGLCDLKKFYPVTKS